MHSALVALANLDFEEDTTRSDTLLSRLTKAQAMLEEAHACLVLEPMSSPAFYQAKVAEDAMEELKNYMAMVADL